MLGAAIVFAVVGVGCGSVGERSSSTTPEILRENLQETTDTPLTIEISGADADSWNPLTILPLVDPRDHGAIGDGVADDTVALQAALDSLREGGILHVGAGTTYRTTDVVRIREDHVKLWASDGGGRILSDTGGRERRQAVVVDGASNVGLFGLEFSSTAEGRLTALEDSAVVLDDATDTEIVGLDIANSASAAVMVFGGSTRTFVTGNVIHHTWADAVHFTDGARDAWVWDNRFFTEAPWPGDDGIACVTYGSGPRCGRMEWWSNVHFGSDWGRGLAVVGGEDIDIHHNTIQRTGAAGILVASEPSYGTAGSSRITVRDNVVVDVGHAVPHSAILISGLDEAIEDVVVVDNTVVTAAGREAFRVEGEVHDLLHSGTAAADDNAAAGLDDLRDFEPSVEIRTVLATRDPSLVTETYRRGLHRVQLRRNQETARFQQRFEYLVVGHRSELENWSSELAGESALFCPAVPTPDEGDDGGEVVGGMVCQLVARTPVPVRIPDSLEPLSFGELRTLARERPELWDHINAL